MSFDSLVVLGPTASGKTRLAAHLAHRLSGAVLSVDSRQVYRGMDIGTGKDLDEYVVEGTPVPHYLINLVDAGAHFDLHQFMLHFARAFTDVTATGKFPVLCGGSGLYLQAVLQRFSFSSVPVNESLRVQLTGLSHDELKNRFAALPDNAFTSLADLSTAKRTQRAIEISTYLQHHSHTGLSMPHLNPLVIGVLPDRDTRRQRIATRLHYRLRHGMMDEVQRLLHSGVPAATLAFYGLEYKYVVMHLQGEMTFAELDEQLTIAIQQFARRQMTFFRKLEREGLPIHWIDASLPLHEQLTRALNLLHTTP